MSPGERAVAAARRVLGVPFRPHGRDPARGLDCVGLAGLALRAGGWGGELPGGYALRGGDPGRVAARIDRLGLVAVAVADIRPGDLLLLASGPGQLHLAIWTGDGLVHADAMLRRVAERPGEPPWPVLGRWRLADD